jgi:hypothetical protein
MFGHLPEDIPADVLLLEAQGMLVAEAGALSGRLPSWFRDWEMPVPRTDLCVLAHRAAEGGFLPEGFSQWGLTGKGDGGGWTVAHEAAFCESLPDTVPPEVLAMTDRNGIAVRDVVAARRDGTATIADGRQIRIGSVDYVPGIGATPGIPVETLEISPGKDGIVPLPTNASCEQLRLEGGWTILVACSIIMRTRTLRPDDPRLLDCKYVDGIPLAHHAAERRVLPAGFTRWDAPDNDGVTVAHYAARRKGGLPEDFTAWDLRDARGIPVAESALFVDALPGDFSAWDMPCKKGAPIAHEAACFGRLPQGYDRWEIRWEAAGQTVAHAAAIAGTLPPGFDGWDLTDDEGRTVAHYAAKACTLPADVPDTVLLMPDRDLVTVAQTILDIQPGVMDHATGLRLKELRDRAKRLLNRLVRDEARRRGRGFP